MTENTIHPGLVLRQCLGGVSVTEAAKRLGVSRITLSAILNGKADISIDMALRLENMLPEHPANYWAYLQADYSIRREREKLRQGDGPLKPQIE